MPVHSGPGLQKWKTPQALFSTLNRVFAFTFDGAADKTNHLLPKWGSNAEKDKWDGERVFINPPFEQMARFFHLAKMREENASIIAIVHRMESCVTRYYNAFSTSFLFIPDSRIQYEAPTGYNGPTDRINFASAISFFGKMEAQQQTRLLTAMKGMLFSSIPKPVDDFFRQMSAEEFAEMMKGDEYIEN